MLREIEGGGQSNDVTVQDAVPVTSEGVSEANTGAVGGETAVENEDKEEGGSTLLTPAQKKAAKKEREKKKKEAARQARLAQQEKAKDSRGTGDQKGVSDENKAPKGNDEEEVSGILYRQQCGGYWYTVTIGEKQVRGYCQGRAAGREGGGGREGRGRRGGRTS